MVWPWTMAAQTDSGPTWSVSQTVSQMWLFVPFGRECLELKASNSRDGMGAPILQPI